MIDLFCTMYLNEWICAFGVAHFVRYSVNLFDENVLAGFRLNPSSHQQGLASRCRRLACGLEKPSIAVGKMVKPARVCNIDLGLFHEKCSPALQYLTAPQWLWHVTLTHDKQHNDNDTCHWRTFRMTVWDGQGTNLPIHWPNNWCRVWLICQNHFYPLFCCV